MKWIETEEGTYVLNTPIGQYKVTNWTDGYYSYLNNEVISRGKDLETAKEEARTHLFTIFYRLKIFLELHE